jgi:amino acid transporter
VNVLTASAIVLVSAAVAIACLLLVRRRAPDGGFYNDGDRAAGVFGVLATGFAVLLGLVVVLAFTSYDASRTGAETEAITVAQQFEVAKLLPDRPGARLARELTCYGRSVVHEEWPRMRAGDATAETSPWGLTAFRTLRTIEPRTAAEQAAYAKWLDLRLDREAARNARIHGAVGVIPGPLWLVLAASAIMIVGFMMVFADSGEPAVVQATLIGSVVVVIVATLLLIRFLDDPYRPGLGSLQPVAMQRTLRVIDQYRRLDADGGPLPCDERGTLRADIPRSG